MIPTNSELYPDANMTPNEHYMPGSCSSKELQQTDVRERLNQHSWEDFARDVALFIAENGLSFNFVNSPTAMELFKVWARQSLPNPRKIKSKLQEEANQLKKRICDFQQQAKKEGTGVVLLSDSWTSSRSKRPYVNHLLFVPNYGLA